MKNLCFSAALLEIIFAINTPANAQIFVSGDVGAGGAAVFTIGSDLTFSISAPGNVQALVFDEWVSSDSGQTGASFSDSLMSYVLNGTPGSVSLQGLYDNHVTTTGDLTPNDGFLFFAGSVPVDVGNTLTLKAGTWNFSGAAGFNPQTVQTFTGNVFLINDGGTRLSGSITAVPEPSEYGLMAGVGLLGWFVWSRKVRPGAAS